MSKKFKTDIKIKKISYNYQIIKNNQDRNIKIKQINK